MKIISNEDKMYLNTIFQNYWRIINLRGNDTFIVERGSGDNIIFLNGILTWSFTWRKLINIMYHDYHLYTLDFKGTGYSEKTTEEYSIDFFTKQVFELINEYNIKNAVLVGNSLGGEVALNIAIKYPGLIRGLVLLDTSGYQKNKEITKILVKLTRFKGTEYLLNMINNKITAQKVIQAALYDESIIDETMVEGYFRPLREKGALEAFFELVKKLDSTEFEYDKIITLTVPALIIWGKYDKLIHFEDAYKFNKDIKDSRIVFIDKCGHAPQEEKPEEVSKAINNFMHEIKNK